MTGWIYIQSYNSINSIYVALAGILTAIGLSGMGGAILDVMKVRLSSPWLQPMGLLTGLTTFSILIQILGILSFTTKGMVIAIWLFSILLGYIWIYYSRNRIFWTPRLSEAKEEKEEYAKLAAFLKIVVILIASWLLLSSIAPSTRHDETSYHIIIGSRIIQDQSLELYRMPMEATVLPHLFYQIAQAPFHAIGLPDAGGVLSWSIVILLCWFLGYLVHDNTGNKLFSILTWFVIVSQPAVINLLITVGPSALAYLSTVIAFFILWDWKSISNTYGPKSGLILITITSITSVSTRIFMLPLSFIILACACLFVLRERKINITDALSVSALWLIAFTPVVGWLWVQSRSPLGILTAEILRSDYYGIEAINAYKATRQLFTNQFLYRFELALWSASLWIVALAYFFTKEKTGFKSIAIILISFQIVVIIFLTPWETRHLAGLQFALFSLGMISINSFSKAIKRNAIIAIIVLTIPWTIVSAFFAYSLSRVSLGIEDNISFLERNSALFQDYIQLDKILPESAILLIGRDKEDINQMGWLSRPPIFYSPRKTYSAVADIPNAHNSLYVIYISPVKTTLAGAITPNIWLPKGYKIGELVYENPHAIFYPSRSGIGGNGLANLTVFRLIKVDVRSNY
ncbi:MAG: hypothetical protein WCH01_03695 [Methylococcaceae bacterium]